MRSGVHTGEIELRGDDIAGIAVHVAARVAALAEPSTVWVSRTVTDLVIGSGIRFRDCADHQLKGVPGAWALYAVTDEQRSNPQRFAATSHTRDATSARCRSALDLPQEQAAQIDLVEVPPNAGSEKLS